MTLRLKPITVSVALVTVLSIAQQVSGQTTTTLSGPSLGQGASGGQPAGGGDLWLTFVCDGYTWANTIDDPVFLNMYLYVEGSGVVANQTFFGWGEVSGQITATVRASTRDRYIECGASGGFGSALDTATILGSGPGSVDTVIRSFIKYNYLRDPYNWTKVFQGDGRWFSTYNASARTTTVYDVYNPAVNDANVLGGPYFGTGLSELYDADTSLAWPEGPITQQALDDWVPGYPMKLDWGFASTASMWCSEPARQGSFEATSTHTFSCVASVSNPLLSFAPAIDYQLNFQLRYGYNRVEYWLSGCHDKFPSFEVYINGQPLLQDDDWGNSLFLWDPCLLPISTQHGYIY